VPRPTCEQTQSCFDVSPCAANLTGCASQGAPPSVLPFLASKAIHPLASSSVARLLEAGAGGAWCSALQPTSWGLDRRAAARLPRGSLGTCCSMPAYVALSRRPGPTAGSTSRSSRAGVAASRRRCATSRWAGCVRGMNRREETRREGRAAQAMSTTNAMPCAVLLGH